MRDVWCLMFDVSKTGIKLISLKKCGLFLHLSHHGTTLSKGHCDLCGEMGTTWHLIWIFWPEGKSNDCLPAELERQLVLKTCLLWAEQVLVFQLMNPFKVLEPGGRQLNSPCGWRYRKTTVVHQGRDVERMKKTTLTWAQAVSQTAGFFFFFAF